MSDLLTWSREIIYRVVNAVGRFRSIENAMIRDETRVDKGYSWVACIMGFVIQCLIAGQNNCSGIIFAALLDEYKTTRGQTGKIKFRVKLFFLSVNSSYGA